MRVVSMKRPRAYHGLVVLIVWPDIVLPDVLSVSILALYQAAHPTRGGLAHSPSID